MVLIQVVAKKAVMVALPHLKKIRKGCLAILKLSRYICKLN
jgi:hypothetical protein